METEVRDVDLAWYIERFRDASRFESFCRVCPNYGKCWRCPPFKHLPAFEVFDRIRIVACRLVVDDGLVGSDVMEALRGTRVVIEEKLLEMERETDGLAFGFSGQCPFCKECSRKDGKPCVKPYKSRPSLEAYGFDLCATMEEIFGRSLVWTENHGDMRREVTLIGAVAYTTHGRKAESELSLHVE